MKAKTVQVAFNILIQPTLAMKNEFNINVKVKNLKQLKALNDDINEALRDIELNHALVDDKGCPLTDEQGRFKMNVAGKKNAEVEKKDWLANTELNYTPIAFRNNAEIKDFVPTFIINDIDFLLPAELLEDPKETPHPALSPSSNAQDKLGEGANAQATELNVAKA